jgi:hypothetical protein
VIWRRPSGQLVVAAEGVRPVDRGQDGQDMADIGREVLDHVDRAV